MVIRRSGRTYAWMGEQDSLSGDVHVVLTNEYRQIARLCEVPLLSVSWLLLRPSATLARVCTYNEALYMRCLYDNDNISCSQLFVCRGISAT